MTFCEIQHQHPELYILMCIQLLVSGQLFSLLPVILRLVKGCLKQVIVFLLFLSLVSYFGQTAKLRYITSVHNIVCSLVPTSNKLDHLTISPLPTNANKCHTPPVTRFLFVFYCKGKTESVLHIGLAYSSMCMAVQVVMCKLAGIFRV